MDLGPACLGELAPLRPNQAAHRERELAGTPGVTSIPVRSGAMSSARPPTREATTGRPQDQASSTTMPNGS